jgi:hypothetical protein
MRGVESPKDDFFAPRSKLSWRAWIIRIVALLVAVGISLYAIAFNAKILFSPHFYGYGKSPSSTEKMLLVLMVTVVQISLLVPCWRIWLFKRWACDLLMVGMLFSAFLFLVLASAGEAWALSALIISIILLWILGEEWTYFKSGF